VPLQRAEDREDRFLNIMIRRIPPARRLFAFDLATGRPRWTHWSRDAATLGIGAFHERATVAAPPVADSERVYTVPALYEGKVDLYVCAYDLRTGAPVWRTALIFASNRISCS
jgi:outer membrane protein assembly factor BamB